MRIRKFLKDTYYTYFNPSSELPFSIQRPPNNYELDIIAKVKPYTMTSPERITAMIRSVDYVLKNNIPGDFVECGVWKGGNIMVMMEVLKKQNTTREIYLYDTFEGMSEATDLDVSTTGKIASELSAKNDKSEEIWCYSPLEEVQELLSKTGYPNELLHYVKGKVEDTLPTTSPNEISLLRLDTDWYESTKIEMEVLYPKLKRTGIFISDDYGYWEGCRTAIDEYFNVKKLNEKMHKIDKASYLNLKKSKQCQNPFAP